MKYKIAFISSMLFMSLLELFPGSTQALSGSDFQPGRIIDDSIFFNSSGMDINTIQAFLNSKVPVCDTNHPSGNPQNQPPFTCLKDYRQDVQGKTPESGLCNGVAAGNKSSAQIIFEVSQSCGVSAKAIIVLLEKEQSLVTDTWPWEIQYRSATGYGCPDTAPCDAEYYGFFNQVYNAARQFKRYARDESSFRYRAYRENYIQYNPNAACGGTNVIIQNQATAGLYNYTPYQPNPSSLANLYGSGDSCGAYGNRNFWRLHNDWFGPTTGEGFSLMTSYNDNGDARQWVVYKGIKRHVPSAEILRAWRLDQLPLIQISGLYLGAIPTSSQPLDRLMRPTGTLDVYFVDNGKCYRITSPDMFAAWNLNPAATVDVSEDLARLPANQGDMTYAVKTDSDARVFLMDGGTLRHLQNTESLEAFEGVGTPITNISLDYYNRAGQGAAISSPRVSEAGGTQFIISNRTRLQLSASVAPLYPWATSQVSNATLQRMGSGFIQPFIRADGDVKVYLADQQKHHVIDPNVLSAWQASGQPDGVSVVSRGVVNLLATGVQLSDYYARNGSDYFLIDKTKKSLPSALVPAYTSTRTVYVASPSLLNLFPGAGSVTNFVKPRGQPQAYLLTNSGVLRHLTSTEKFNLWAGANPVTELNAANIGRYTNGGGIGVHVSDGTNEYVMDGGVKATVSGAIKSSWKLGSSEAISDGTLNNFSTGSALTNEIQQTGQYFLVSEGVSYGTVDGNIADMWGIDTAPVHNSNLIREFLSQQPMTRFARAKNPSDTRLFIVNDGILYHLSPQQASNLGVFGPPMAVDPEGISKQAITLWGGILVKAESGSYYVIDGGGKRHFGHSIIFDHWRRTIALSAIPTVTDGFVNTLPSRGSIERAIKGLGPAVYSADSITKRWIRSTQTYNSSFAPFAQVSDSLINVLPNGADIP